MVVAGAGSDPATNPALKRGQDRVTCNRADRVCGCQLLAMMWLLHPPVYVSRGAQVLLFAW